MNRSYNLVLPVALAALGCLAGLAAADTGVVAAAPSAVTSANEASMEAAFAKEERFRARLARLESLHKAARRTRDTARLHDAERELAQLQLEHKQFAEARRKQLGAEGEARFEEGLKRRAALEKKRRQQRQDARHDGRDTRQEVRGEARDMRHGVRAERREMRQSTRQDAREERQDSRKEAREERRDTRQSNRESRKK